MKTIVQSLELNEQRAPRQWNKLTLTNPAYLEGNLIYHALKVKRK